eukprot:3228386-Rhodomonas_salina.1
MAQYTHHTLAQYTHHTPSHMRHLSIQCHASHTMTCLSTAHCHTLGGLAQRPARAMSQLSTAQCTCRTRAQYCTVHVPYSSSVPHSARATRQLSTHTRPGAIR